MLQKVQSSYNDANCLNVKTFYIKSTCWPQSTVKSFFYLTTELNKNKFTEKPQIVEKFHISLFVDFLTEIHKKVSLLGGNQIFYIC